MKHPRYDFADSFAMFGLVVELRGEEVWAAACLEAALAGTMVRQRDDNSVQAVHDLDIVRDGTVVGACEVTAAADRQLTELWNLVNGRGGRHIEPTLLGGWSIALRPTCRVNKLTQGLCEFLEDLEGRRISEVGRSWGPTDVEHHLNALGIEHAVQSGTDYPGSVYFTIALPAAQTSGMVPETGDGLVEWLDGWMSEPARENKVEKLRRSPASEKHLFVIVPGLSQTPFVAADVLMRDNGPLPTRPPRLPDGLTHLWVMSAWSSGDLFAWLPSGEWKRYNKINLVSN